MTTAQPQKSHKSKIIAIYEALLSDSQSNQYVKAFESDKTGEVLDEMLLLDLHQTAQIEALVYQLLQSNDQSKGPSSTVNRLKKLVDRCIAFLESLVKVENAATKQQQQAQKQQQQPLPSLLSATDDVRVKNALVLLKIVIKCLLVPKAKSGQATAQRRDIYALVSPVTQDPDLFFQRIIMATAKQLYVYHSEATGSAALQLITLLLLCACSNSDHASLLDYFVLVDKYSLWQPLWRVILQPNGEHMQEKRDVMFVWTLLVRYSSSEVFLRMLEEDMKDKRRVEALSDACSYWIRQWCDNTASKVCSKQDEGVIASTISWLSSFVITAPVVETAKKADLRYNETAAILILLRELIESAESDFMNTTVRYLSLLSPSDADAGADTSTTSRPSRKSGQQRVIPAVVQEILKFSSIAFGMLTLKSAGSNDTDAEHRLYARIAAGLLSGLLNNRVFRVLSFDIAVKHDGLVLYQHDQASTQLVSVDYSGGAGSIARVMLELVLRFLQQCANRRLLAKSRAATNSLIESLVADCLTIVHAIVLLSRKQRVRLSLDWSGLCFDTLFRVLQQTIPSSSDSDALVSSERIRVIYNVYAILTLVMLCGEEEEGAILPHKNDFYTLVYELIRRREEIILPMAHWMKNETKKSNRSPTISVLAKMVKCLEHIANDINNEVELRYAEQQNASQEEIVRLIRKNMEGTAKSLDKSLLNDVDQLRIGVAVSTAGESTDPTGNAALRDAIEWRWSQI